MDVRPYDPAVYRRFGRRIVNNLAYIGNVKALAAWYRIVRRRTMDDCPYRAACRLAALDVLASIEAERVKRLSQVAEKLPGSIERLRRAGSGVAAELALQERFLAGWPAVRERLAVPADRGDEEVVWERLSAAAGETSSASGHVAFVQAAPAPFRSAVTEWLDGVVRGVVDTWRPDGGGA